MECDKEALEDCKTDKLVKHFADQGILKGDETILVFGVVHPGTAKFDGGPPIVRSSFGRAAKTVAQYIKNNPGWLPADPDEERFAHCYGGARMERLNTGFFEYGYAPIPFKDFAFATNWRMGHAGTTSNRNGQDQILVFSEMGDYEESKPSNAFRLMNFDSYFAPEATRDQLLDVGRGRVYGMKENEVPYEPPRYSGFGEDKGDLDHVQQFDPGPLNPQIAEALMSWPNFKEILPQAYVNHESFGFGPSYRGNLVNPEVVIVADQLSHTDMFSTRALTGEAGQALQTWLQKTGLEASDSYLILRPLPVDTLGIETEQKIKLATLKDSQGRSALKVLESVLKQLEGDKTLLTMGPVSKALANELRGTEVDNILEVIEMAQPTKDFEHISNWIGVASVMGIQLTEADLKAMFVIPRKDLPYSTRWWMGTTGDLAQRGEAKSERSSSEYNGHYYRLEAPWWIRNLYNEDPRELNSTEKSLIDQLFEDYDL
jgi:hypothetical protein